MSVAEIRDLVRANAELALTAVAERLDKPADELRAVGIEEILERYGRACAKAALDSAGASLSPFDDDETTRPYPIDWVDRADKKK